MFEFIRIFIKKFCLNIVRSKTIRICTDLLESQARVISDLRTQRLISFLPHLLDIVYYNLSKQLFYFFSQRH